ncbi:MAG: leucine-rich repeat protein [Muribaculaceae bacterium]|nr:leucine-rich repeat protein [Muribaculaceae bacterium]
MKPQQFKLISIVILLLSFPKISAYDFEVDGNLFFEIISPSELTCKLESVNRNYEGVLTIPESVDYKGNKLAVTVIGTNCIRFCDKLTDIIVPASIKSMEEECFANCISIQSANLEQIEASILPQGCFKNSSIQNIILPTHVIELPNEFFYGCRNLSNFTIPEGVVKIGDSCFASTKLESICIPESLLTLGKGSFSDATIASTINLPEGLLEIGDYTFRNASLPYLYIPSKVSQVGIGIFQNCQIRKVEFSSASTIQTLPEKMFYQSSLENIIFPPNLINIGDGCFTNCKNLSQLDFPNTIESLGYQSLAGLNLDFFCLTENLKYVNYKCFNDRNSSWIDNTTIKKLVWTTPNLNENYFDAALNSEKYYELDDLEDASFDFGSVIECEISDNCDFLYLGWVQGYLLYSDHGWRHYRYFVFENSSLQKLVLKDSPKTLQLATVYHFSGNYFGKNYVRMYKGYFPYKENEEVYDYFLSTWMESLKELYLGREIEGNPLYVPNLERLIIGQVQKVDIENTPLPNLKSIECVSDIPPIISEDHFTIAQYVDLPVVVPDNAIENYRKAEVWKNFWNIMTKTDYEASIPKDISLNYSDLTLNIGENLQLTASLYPETASGNIIFVSSNEEVASVSEEGLITANSVGETIITASCGGISTTCTICVVNPINKAEQIVLNLELAELNIGETLQIEATVIPEDTTDKTLSWNSSDPNVATVSDNGLVTAVSAGSVIITAICGEVSAECQITVLDDAGVESLLANPDTSISVYSMDGNLIRKDCKVEDLKTLNKGTYIIVSGKEQYKISI